MHVDTDRAKLWLHQRFRWPVGQPGGWFVYEDEVDGKPSPGEDYFKSLISEARVMRPSGRATWVKRNRDNHWLDCEALAYVAGLLLNVQHIPMPALTEPPKERPSTTEARRGQYELATDPFAEGAPVVAETAPASPAANAPLDDWSVAYSPYVGRRRP